MSRPEPARWIRAEFVIGLATECSERLECVDQPFRILLRQLLGYIPTLIDAESRNTGFVGNHCQINVFVSRKPKHVLVHVGRDGVAPRG